MGDTHLNTETHMGGVAEGLSNQTGFGFTENLLINKSLVFISHDINYLT